MNTQECVARLQAELGLKRLTPGFAKFEILFGLAGVWAGLLLLLRSNPGFEDIATLAASAILFVLSGYLAMAGSRSHLYQSNNVLTAYLAELVKVSRSAEKA